MHSISFTSDSVVRALLGWLAEGLEVTKDLLDRGLVCLEVLRTADRTFEYMFGPGEKASGRRPPPAGAAGRGPVCALALFEGRRAELRSVRESLDLFLEHRGSFAKELGKVLIHTGPEGQGSHYLLFDYAGAAAAIARLPRGERIKYARPLLELILAARTRGGGFIDNPPRGIAGGTGLALLALESLGAR
jgi:hypothetical protein